MSIPPFHACFPPTPLQRIEHPILDEKGLLLSVKRDDLIHPVVSGNKWRKLKYILRHAQTLNATHLISMGGPYSNHLHTLAYLGKEMGFRTTGLIRGEHKNLSPALKDMRHWGMQIEFVSRDTYRQLRNHKKFDAPPSSERNGYWIAEGGYNPLALRGIEEMIKELPVGSDIIFTAPCGTGCTLAGIINAAPTETRVQGVSVLKGDGYLQHEVSNLLDECTAERSTKAAWAVSDDYHFGGFGKVNKHLTAFMTEFENHTGIPLDPVYTGKLFYGLADMILKDQFPSGSHLIAIHTGGLQGRRTI